MCVPCLSCVVFGGGPDILLTAHSGSPSPHCVSVYYIRATRWRLEWIGGAGGTWRYTLILKLLSAYITLEEYWYTKTRAVNVCETGIISSRARCACATIPPSRLHARTVFSWRDNSSVLVHSLLLPLQASVPQGVIPTLDEGEWRRKKERNKRKYECRQRREPVTWAKMMRAERAERGNF